MKDGEAGLLKGYNCSIAMAPRKILVGEGDKPYAIQTDLGWSIVGCLDLPNVSGFCYRLVCKELPSVTPVDAIRVLESDFKD